MNTISLASAMEALRRAAAAGGSRLSGQVLAETARLNLEILDNVLQAATHRSDPRVAAGMSSIVETLSHRISRARLELALLAEATGAHTLDLEEYDDLREGRTDYSRPARYAAGRPCYKTTADFLAAWLRITYFEAEGMLNDAHLVIGRVTIAGTLTTPRFEQLGTTYQDPAVDPRATLQTARSLNRLEPKDTIGEGAPLPPAARQQDGPSLEERAVQILEGNEPRTAKKQVNELVKKYKEENAEAATPELGLFKRRSINGVDEYVLRVRGSDAGFMRSLVAQADNPRTKAGAAARTRQPDEENLAGREADPAVDSTQTPSWLQPTDPPPPWAVDETGETEPAAGPTGAQIPENTEGLSPAEQIDLQVPVPMRRMNAMMTLIRQNGSGTAKTKAIRPQLMVFMQLDDLRDLATAHGITTHGVRLTPGELRRLLTEADIIPVVFGGESQILDLGRASRFYPDYLRDGIICRDKGCIVPGCTEPPENCDVHHFEGGGWKGGCRTRIGSGSLMCRNDHTAEQAGIIKVVNYKGLPHVIMPKHIDPTQTPQRNTYWDNI